MGLSTTAKNTALDAVTITYVSLHTADPGDDGSNEVTGGSPAYAREAITVDAASAGSRSASTQPTFDVPASTTVTHVGYWSAIAGTYQGSATLASQEFTTQGTYQLLTSVIDFNA